MARRNFTNRFSEKGGMASRTCKTGLQSREAVAEGPEKMDCRKRKNSPPDLSKHHVR